MCGIAGLISLLRLRISRGQQSLNMMINLLAHRGLDGHRTWISEDGSVGLGHQRLAIIDLSESAAQPMIGEAGRVISFNGEIYNYRELRAQFDSYDVIRMVIG